MTLTPEQKPLLINGSEGRFIHRLMTDRQLDFWSASESLAATAEFASVATLGDGRGDIAVAETALDDFFSDDITFPAMDGYLLGATLFLPLGAKRDAVLIKSATAGRRKIYRGFAGYLARRGCAVLTYDYRGTGDSRRKSPGGSNPPRSPADLKARLSDWGAVDVT